MYFIGYYLASYLDFLGLQYISASLERLILFLAPTFVLLLSALLLDEPMTVLQLVGTGITLTGALVLIRRPGPPQSKLAQGANVPPFLTGVVGI